MEKLIEANKLARQYFEKDIASFVLKNSLKLNKNSLQMVAEQMESLKKANSKLPTFFQNEAILMPPPLTLEQCSSEKTAILKSSLITGDTLADLTGGMGIDCYFLSKSFQHTYYIEQNEHVARVATYNFSALQQNQISVINTQAENFIQQYEGQLSCVYLDPARRDTQKQKVVYLSDCEPNILDIKEILFKKTKQILLKTSPLLDIKLAIQQLENVCDVYVVAVKNEVKELLFKIQKEFIGEAKIHALNYDEKWQEFNFTFAQEQALILNFSNPKSYLYEPNAAILKAGAFKSITTHFAIEKLASNSHLYTSNEFFSDFQGRIFRILAITKFDKKQIAQDIQTGKANISTRNFPLSVDEIKKKMGIKDGGEKYLFFTEDFLKNKIVLVCEK